MRTEWSLKSAKVAAEPKKSQLDTRYNKDKKKQDTEYYIMQPNKQKCDVIDICVANRFTLRRLNSICIRSPVAGQFKILNSVHGFGLFLLFRSMVTANTRSSEK